MDRRIGVWYPIQLLRLNLAPPIGVELRHFPNGEFCLFLCGAGALITNSRLTQVLHEKNKRAGRGVKGREEAVRRRHLRTPGNVLVEAHLSLVELKEIGEVAVLLNSGREFRDQRARSALGTAFVFQVDPCELSQQPHAFADDLLAKGTD